MRRHPASAAAPSQGAGKNVTFSGKQPKDFHARASESARAKAWTKEAAKN
jgi:hypothetical protein